MLSPRTVQRIRCCRAFSCCVSRQKSLPLLPLGLDRIRTRQILRQVDDRSEEIQARSRVLSVASQIHRWRVTHDKLWLKLLHAAENLQKSDLRSFQLGMYPFELVQAVATTWCSLACEAMRFGDCELVAFDGVRRNRSRGMRRDPAERWPLFPFGPVNETGTAFAKPVQRAVDKRILTDKPTFRCEIPWAKLRLTARGQRLQVHFTTRPRDSKSIPVSLDRGS